MTNSISNLTKFLFSKTLECGLIGWQSSGSHRELLQLQTSISHPHLHTLYFCWKYFCKFTYSEPHRPPRLQSHLLQSNSEYRTNKLSVKLTDYYLKIIYFISTDRIYQVPSHDWLRRPLSTGSTTGPVWKHQYQKSSTVHRDYLQDIGYYYQWFGTQVKCGGISKFFHREHANGLFYLKELPNYLNL